MDELFTRLSVGRPADAVAAITGTPDESLRLSVAAYAAMNKKLDVLLAVTAAMDAAGSPVCAPHSRARARLCCCSSLCLWK
jgi:hypothetical protein